MIENYNIEIESWSLRYIMDVNLIKLINLKTFFMFFLTTDGAKTHFFRNITHKIVIYDKINSIQINLMKLINIKTYFAAF